MDFELRSAREKLEREQRERKERAKLKLEREKKAKEAAIRQREAIEASQRARRLDAIEAQIKVRIYSYALIVGLRSWEFGFLENYSPRFLDSW